MVAVVGPLQLLGWWDGVDAVGGWAWRSTSSLQSPSRSKDAASHCVRPHLLSPFTCGARCPVLFLPPNPFLQPPHTCAGASGFVIEPSVAQEFRLPAFGDLSIAGVAGKVRGTGVRPKGRACTLHWERECFCLWCFDLWAQCTHTINTVGPQRLLTPHASNHTFIGSVV